MNELKISAIAALRNYPNVRIDDIKRIIEQIKVCYMSTTGVGQTGCELYFRQEMGSDHQTAFPMDVSRCNLYLISELQSFIDELNK